MCRKLWAISRHSLRAFLYFYLRNEIWKLLMLVLWRLFWRPFIIFNPLTTHSSSTIIYVSILRFYCWSIGRLCHTRYSNILLVIQLLSMLWKKWCFGYYFLIILCDSFLDTHLIFNSAINWIIKFCAKVYAGTIAILLCRAECDSFLTWWFI